MCQMIAQRKLRWVRTLLHLQEDGHATGAMPASLAATEKPKLRIGLLFGCEASKH